MRGRVRLLTVSVLLLLVGGFVAVLVTSLAGAAVLLESLESQTSPVEPQQLRGHADAVVVLTGRPERVETAVRLQLATPLLLAVVGRDGLGEPGDPIFLPSRTALKVLRPRHGLEPRWIEPKSKDTRQNAW